MGIVEGVIAHEAEKAVGVAVGGAAGGPVGAAFAFVKAYWKPILLGIAALVVAAVVLTHFANDRHVRKERDGLQSWQTTTVAITAAALPKLDNGKLQTVKSSDVVADIQWLGTERERLEKALDDQTLAVNVAKQKALDDQNAYQAALQRASERDKQRAATRSALTDPKRSSGLNQAEWSQL